MKIHYLSFSRIPSRDANSIHVMSMCESITTNGHEVTLFAKKAKKLGGNIFDYYGVANSFKVVRSVFPRIPIIGDMIYGIETLRKLLFFSTPDLYYGRHPYLMFFVAFTNTPLIYEAHDVPESRVHKLVENRILNAGKFKRLVLISEALKKEYTRIFPKLDENKILVAHDGAQLATKNPSSVAIINQDKDFHVGYTGHLYPGRGINVIMKIAKKLPSIQFHIIGGSEQDIKKWHHRNEANNVHFYGHVPHHDIPAYLNQFDVLLAPYQKKVTIGGGKGDTSRWMSPLKIFEYMAAKKPIICSSLPVLQEVLKDNYNALLCNPENERDWIQAINKLKHNKELRITLGNNARDTLENAYTWEIRARNILSL